MNNTALIPASPLVSHSLAVSPYAWGNGCTWLCACSLTLTDKFSISLTKEKNHNQTKQNTTKPTHCFSVGFINVAQLAHQKKLHRKCKRVQ